MNDFTGRSILITGAGSGIGRATALLLAGSGANLALVDIDASGVAETERLVRDEVACARTITVVADVSDDSQVRGYVESTVKEFGHIDGFFNNAGIEARPGLLDEIDVEVLNRLISVNLVGSYQGLHHVLRVMRRQESGAVVNMSSVTGVVGAGAQAAYSATKHAVVGLTRSAALEYGKFGVRVNAVTPGGILTPMAVRAMRAAAGDAWESLIPMAGEPNPMKRIGRPEDVAGPVAFLLSDQAAFVNGATLTIDGGQSVGEQA
ncbi:SDR family oxidoreductase [Rhodococcus sp. T2V]|uniref:SDR family oxidoreductase n=1 Tax=Rhodococcus sp. T2V TaxID=3034164 RepID=UPI0023E17D1D|nr:SDR family oxidoreductase [Rhodococcus sp. T2V]MDF3309699.1 SDR family oxidoreductase [Rhodococcus sp. T2V]